MPWHVCTLSFRLLSLTHTQRAKWATHYFSSRQNLLSLIGGKYTQEYPSIQQQAGKRRCRMWSVLWRWNEKVTSPNISSLISLFAFSIVHSYTFFLMCLLSLCPGLSFFIFFFRSVLRAACLTGLLINGSWAQGGKKEEEKKKIHMVSESLTCMTHHMNLQLAIGSTLIITKFTFERPHILGGKGPECKQVKSCKYPRAREREKPGRPFN